MTNLTQIQWFGKSWGAPVCAQNNHKPTPVGKVCIQCDKPISEGDQGVSMTTAGPDRAEMHLDCFLTNLGIK